MPLAPRLLTELAGSFFFMSVIAFSPEAGSLAPVAVGLALTAMVYMGGHVSGAHYNPAVSFGLLLRRVIDARTMAAYWAAQIVGGLLAFFIADLISGRTPGLRPGGGTVPALAAETLFTAALVTVVLNVAATRETAGNSYFGLAIGFTVAAGAFAVGPISGAAFNPAVAIGATVVAAVRGHGDFASVWIYLAGPLLGAAVAAGIHRFQAVITVRPEKAERTTPR